MIPHPYLAVVEAARAVLLALDCPYEMMSAGEWHGSVLPAEERLEAAISALDSASAADEVTYDPFRNCLQCKVALSDDNRSPNNVMCHACFDGHWQTKLKGKK